MVVEFERNEKILSDLTVEIQIYTVEMDRLIESIQEVAKQHNRCGTA